MPKPQTRLLGRWKSDKRRTLKTCHSYHARAGSRKRTFTSIFGKLEVRFTRTRVYYSLPGTQWSSRYQVVAADADSLVLMIHPGNLWKMAPPITADLVKLLDVPRLYHLSFVRLHGREYYWIGCGTFCEWFRRLYDAD